MAAMIQLLLRSSIPPPSVPVLTLVLLMAAGSDGTGAWRVASIDGADIRSLAIDPRNPDLVVAGSASGHVYLSRDGGASWGDAGDPVPLPGYVVGTLKFDPHQPGRLWAALQGVWGSGTVTSTDDLGRTWVARGKGLPEEPIYTIAFDATRKGHLYAATLSGVHHTTDGGDRWDHLSRGNLLVRNVSSLWIDPDRPMSIMAGTFRRAYKSDDGGQTWRGIFEGMELDSQVFTLTGDGRELWASTCGWVYRSLDRGEHWQRFKEGLAERRTPAFLPLPDGRLLAGTTAGLYMSIDRGKSWHRRTDTDVVVNAIAVDARRAERILLATEGGGIVRSVDAGATFGPSGRGMSNLRVAGMTRAGGDLLVAIRDAGPVSGIYRSRDAGASWNLESRSLPPVIALRAFKEGAFAATEKGLYARTGVIWKPVPALASKRVLDVALPATTSDPRFVVTTESGIYQGAPGALAPLAAAKEPALSAASWGPGVWLSTGSGLLRVQGTSREGVAVPFLGGRLLASGPHLVYAGSGGMMLRSVAAPSWETVTRSATRVLATGDDRRPLLLIHGEVAELFDPATGDRDAIELHVPARDVTAVLLDGDNLWIGTSGYGLLVGKRPVLRASLTSGGRSQGSSPIAAP